MNAWAIIQHKVYHDQERTECEVRGPGCNGRHEQGHHMLTRKKRFMRYLNAEVNYIPCCRICNVHTRYADTYEAAQRIARNQAERYDVREWINSAPEKLKLGLEWQQADLILKEIENG